MKNERTYDEAVEAFVRFSKLPNWIKRIYLYFCTPVFPLCVRIDDSRTYGKDTDEDYLLTHHFLTIEEEESGFYSLVGLTTCEPEGEYNEPYEIMDSYPGREYRWPVRSLRHAQRLASDFFCSIQTKSAKI